MANSRRAFGRFEAALGLIGVLALGGTYIVITGWNPWPQMQADLTKWMAQAGSLAEPKASWSVRVGDSPTAAVVAGSTVLITHRGSVEARGLVDGTPKWNRDADWAALAGVGPTSVAIVGKKGSGLVALDPATGATKWKDASATAVWTYTDAVLTLACSGLTDCTLRDRDPGNGNTRWTMTLPGIGRVLSGANTALLHSRELSGTFASAIDAVPRPLPAMLGFPTDQRIQVVDTSDGKRLREAKATDTSRVVVLGGRVLTSTATPKDGSCRYTLEADDAASGRLVWKREGYDLHTADGAGCEQREDPPGDDTYLAATRGDNKDAFLSTHDGREVWVAPDGLTAVAAYGGYGVVRTPDKTSIHVLDLAHGGHTLWTKTVPAGAGIAVTDDAVFVNIPDSGEIIGYAPATGAKILDEKTDGQVLGFGPTGVMLGRGRLVGFVPFT